LKLPGATDLRAAMDEGTAAVVDAVLEASDRLELAVYAVGGPVRDLLLGQPLRDMDLLVEGNARELLGSASLQEARVTRHDRFGTIHLKQGGAELDIAATRRESYPHSGSLPRVEPGSLEEDLHRRDFSVNALALPLSKIARKKYRQIVDLHDGLQDLENRQLRVLHARSFHDDPTRALRAARLSPRLGLALTRGSRAALRDALRDGAFGHVSGDRLRRELVKLCEDATLGLDPARGLKLLSTWHVLGALEPGLESSPSAIVPLRRLGRSIADPPWSSSRWRPWVSALSVWLAPLSPALRRRTLRRFSVRGDLAARISRFPRSRDACLAALLRARGRGPIDALLAPLSEEELHALYASAEAKARRRILRFASEDRGRRLPLTGDDLIDIGLRGPAVGRALMRIRTAYLDGAVSNRVEAIALARELASRRSHARTKLTAKSSR